jgi:hypothetical protein
MVYYVEAPDRQGYGNMTVIFMAGGITGCPDWQQEMRDLLNETDLVLLNPRRADFPIGDSNAAKEQITWEYDHLRLADAILFWFPREALCPIVLYELGAWAMTEKPLFVGVHPDYERRRDIEIQLGLARPEIEIVYVLQELALQVGKYLDIPKG